MDMVTAVNLIGTQEVAAILGVTTARVRVLRRTYGLGQCVAGRYLFDRRQIVEFAKSRKREAGPRRKGLS